MGNQGVIQVTQHRPPLCTKVGELVISDRVNIEDVRTTRTIWQGHGKALLCAVLASSHEHRRRHGQIPFGPALKNHTPIRERLRQSDIVAGAASRSRCGMARPETPPSAVASGPLAAGSGSMLLAPCS